MSGRSNVKTVWLVGVTLFVGFCCSLESVSQTPENLKTWFPFSDTSAPLPPIDPKAFRISSDVEMVMLDVSVKDSAGGFVSGLAKENFRIFENGKEQEIRTFEAGDVPVTIGLIVDNSGSMRPKRGDVVTAALTFVQQSNSNDQMFVVNFNDRVSLGLPPGVDFTDDRIQLRDALLRNPAQGRTALNDALRMGLAHLEKGKYEKKTLILVSDGGDNASEVTEHEIVKMAQESLTTIYTIGIYDEGDRDKNPGFLKRLANLTGGECYLPEKLTQLVEVCSRIAKDIRNRYAMSYVPKDIKFDGSVKRLRVIASAQDRGKLVVRSRTQYVAVPRGKMPSILERMERAQKNP